MSAEQRLVYKALDVIEPDEARKVGIVTEQLVLVDSATRVARKMGKGLNSSECRPNALLEARDINGEQQKLLTFPDLKTVLDWEALGYWGNAPYSGFIAVGEAVGEYSLEPISDRISDLCVRAEAMRIIGIKAFINEQEVCSGSIRRLHDNSTVTSYLVMDDGKNIESWRPRYDFRINPGGEVVFSGPFRQG